MCANDAPPPPTPYIEFVMHNHFYPSFLYGPDVPATGLRVSALATAITSALRFAKTKTKDAAKFPLVLVNPATLLPYKGKKWIHPGQGVLVVRQSPYTKKCEDMGKESHFNPLKGEDLFASPFGFLKQIKQKPEDTMPYVVLSGPRAGVYMSSQTAKAASPPGRAPEHYKTLKEAHMAIEAYEAGRPCIPPSKTITLTSYARESSLEKCRGDTLRSQMSAGSKAVNLPDAFKFNVDFMPKTPRLYVQGIMVPVDLQRKTMGVASWCLLSAGEDMKDDTELHVQKLSSSITCARDAEIAAVTLALKAIHRMNTSSEKSLSLCVVTDSTFVLYSIEKYSKHVSCFSGGTGHTDVDPAQARLIALTNSMRPYKHVRAGFLSTKEPIMVKLRMACAAYVKQKRYITAGE